MSEATPETEAVEEAAPPAEPFPNSWIATGVGLLGMVAAGVVTAFLSMNYLASRPIDLRSASKGAVAALEERLYANRVPLENIQAIAPVLHATPKAHWYFQELEVEVPEHLSVEGVEALLDKEMRRRNVVVSDYYENGRKEGLNLGLGDYPVAKVRLWQSQAPRQTNAPPWTPVQTDEGAMAVEEPSPDPSTMAPAEMTPTAPGDDGASMETPPDSPEILTETPAEETGAEEPAANDPAVMEEDLAPLEPPSDERVWTPPVARGKSAPTAPATRIQVARLPAPMGPEPKLAIIVDDGGWEVPAMERILVMDPHLTLSILPYTPKGAELAERALAAGFEVMLHMPMENLDPQMTFEGQLTTKMNEDEIAALTAKALAEVPGAVGINNHTGSKYTSDPRAMALFLTTLAGTNLYFVDSVTIADTRAYEMAQAFGIKSARRDLFLDHDKAPDEIRKRFLQVLDIAKTKGEAIAICHFITPTADILEELMPMIAQDGIQLVHASELVK